MKLIGIVITLFFAACLLVLAPGYAGAMEGYAVESYAETYTPGENGSGILTVRLKANPALDGYVYLVKSFGKMNPKGLSETQNVQGGIETYKSGDTELFRVKAPDSGSPVSLTAVFDCPAFYGAKAKAGETGSPSIPVSSKFTNPFTTAIGSYSVKVILGEGEEIVNVSAPKAYADYTLGKEGDSRSVSVSKKKLAALGGITLTFSYGKTLANRALGVTLLWLVCLALGIAVLIARFPRRKI